jgi:hypothetical protein
MTSRIVGIGVMSDSRRRIKGSNSPESRFAMLDSAIPRSSFSGT